MNAARRRKRRILGASDRRTLRSVTAAARAGGRCVPIQAHSRLVYRLEGAARKLASWAAMETAARRLCARLEAANEQHGRVHPHDLARGRKLITIISEVLR